MDADEDPGGWSIDPAVAFYGLWPRFDADEDAGGLADVQPVLSTAE